MTKRYMVFNVGCIECGVGSDVVGFYDDQAEAESVAEYLDTALRWRQGGQNSFEVFDLQADQAKEYADALAARPTPSHDGERT